MTNNASLRVIGQSMEGVVPKPIQKMLVQNEDLFRELTELPPQRSHDHRIILKPDAQPVNLRPYCYLYHHKTELEKQVKEMLDLGIICPSQSSYPSPALSVGKRDSTL